MALGAVIAVELGSSTLSNVAALGSRLDSVRQKIGLTSSGAASMASVLGVASFAGTALLGTLTGIAAVGIKTAATFEQQRIAFTTMLGSADAANKFLGELQAFAKSTPFEFAQLVPAAQRMKALGFETEEIIPRLTEIGNAVSGMGGGSEMVDRVVLALGQMKAKAHATSQDMNQLLETGTFGWNDLAKAIGKSVPETMKLVEDRAVSADAVIRAFAEHSNASFGGMMEAQSHTFLGMLSNLKDQAGFTMRDMFTPMLEALKPVLDDVVKLTQFMGGPEVKAFGDGMGMAVTFLLDMGRQAGAFVQTWIPAGVLTDEMAGKMGVLVVFGTALLAVVTPIAGALSAAAGFAFLLGDLLLPVVAVIGTGIAGALGLLSIGFIQAQIGGFTFGETLSNWADFATRMWGKFRVQFNQIVGDISGPATMAVEILRSAWTDTVAAFDVATIGMGTDIASLAASFGIMVGWVVKAGIVMAELGVIAIGVGAKILRYVVAPLSRLARFVITGMVGVTSAIVDVIGQAITSLGELSNNPVVAWALKKLGVGASAAAAAQRGGTGGAQTTSTMGGFVAPTVANAKLNLPAPTAPGTQARVEAAGAQNGIAEAIKNAKPPCAKIRNELTVDGKKMAVAQKEVEVELTERAGFSMTPWQRRVIMEHGAVPVGGG